MFADTTALRERRIQVADMRAPKQMGALGGLNAKEEVEYYLKGRMNLKDESKEQTRTYVNDKHRKVKTESEMETNSNDQI